MKDIDNPEKIKESWDRDSEGKIPEDYVYYWLTILQDEVSPQNVLESYCKLIQILYEKEIINQNDVRRLVK